MNHRSRNIMLLVHFSRRLLQKCLRKEKLGYKPFEKVDNCSEVKQKNVFFLKSVNDDNYTD